MMKSTNHSQKILATAILCSLLSTGSVWAAQQATDTVTGENNVSTAADPYSKIEVKTTDTDAIGINANVYSDGSSNLQVYMSSDGVINVSAAPTAKDTSFNAFGIQNYRSADSQSDTTLTVTGPTTLTVDSTGGEGTGALDSGGNASSVSGNAYGMNLSNGSSTSLGVVKATVSATGGKVTGTVPAGTNLDINANANAYGVMVNQAKLSTGAAGFTVTAQGGTVSGGASNAGVGAYGIEAWDGSTVDINGNLVVDVKGVGGTETGTGKLRLAFSYASGVDSTNSTLTVTGPLTGTVAAQGGVARSSGSYSINTSASAEAHSVSNQSYANSTNKTPAATINVASADLTVKATGGTAAGAGASATGIYNFANGGTATMDSTGFVKTTVAATGGTGSADSIWTDATGINNYAQEVTEYNSETHIAYGTATFQAGSVESTVTASGGSTSAANGIGTVSAMGVANYGYGDNKATLTVTGSTTVAATATANVATPSNVEAKGLYNSGDTSAVMSLQDATVTATAAGGNTHNGNDATTTAQAISNSSGVVTARNLNLTATATGGAQLADVTQTRETDAYGIYSDNGTVSATGAVTIKTSVTPGGGDREYFAADSLYATNNSTINVGTDGTQATGTTVQMEGDVQATNGGVVNLTLATAASYLQGNVFTTSKKTTDGNAGDTGTVNLTVTNGAAWRPVYDNRYGSQNTVDAKDTYDEDGNYLSTDYTYKTPAQTTTTTENSIGSLTLSNGGIVDLTWDNRTRTDSFRTLTVGNLSGDGGIFKVNTDLAHNTGDQVILGSGSTSTSVGIDVAYDPYLATENLVATNSISGKALVLTDQSSNLVTVSGVQDSYNLYDYVPTITDNGDHTYSVTALTITNARKKTVTSPSRPMRDTRNSRLALHNLWVNGELNNLTKRLGDLRAMEPAEAGIWARYEHNNLDQGDDVSLKYNMVQVGYDKSFAGTNGTTYRGAAMSYAKGTGDYEVSSGDVKETALSLYQTWIGKDGRYYDVILKGGKLMNDFDYNYGSNPFSADYNTWGYAVSGEFGKRLYHGNGVYVEPQVELTLGKINSTDCTTSTGMDVHMDGQNTALTRIGIAVGREIKNVGSYYFKASYYHDFGGGLDLTASDVSTNPFSYSGDVAKNWCVFTLGGARKVGTNCNVFAEFSRFTGQLSNNLQYNVGARWKI